MKWSDKVRKFAFQALAPSSTRKQIRTMYVSVDKELENSKRSLAINTALDALQNCAIVHWCVEMHKTYTSSFRLQFRGEYANMLNAYWYKRSKAKNIDVYGLLNFDEILRAAQGEKLVSGESFILKIENGKFQLISSDLVKKSDGSPENTNENGVIVDKAGIPQAFSVCSFVDGSVKFASAVPFEDIIYSAYRITPSQVRGTSPLMPVLNAVRDLTDIQSYYLMKQKMAAIFGIVIYRKNDAGMTNDFNEQNSSGDSSNEDDRKFPEYTISSGMKLELDSEDRAEFMESKTPPQEYMQFTTYLNRQILAALKIPYSAYDSSATNFSAAKGDMQRYKMLTEPDREAMKRVADEMLEHVLKCDIASGVLPIPYDAIEWEFLPSASFSIDLSSDVKTCADAVASGFKTRSDAIIELGNGTFAEVTNTLAREEAVLREEGITVALGQPGATTTQDVKENE